MIELSNNIYMVNITLLGPKPKTLTFCIKYDVPTCYIKTNLKDLAFLSPTLYSRTRCLFVPYNLITLNYEKNYSFNSAGKSK